jgi:FMN-dependent NADH-azoreductase
MNLLHVDSSILGVHSASRPVTAAVVDRFRQTAPDLKIIYRDVSATPLPHLTPAQLPSDHPLSALASPPEVAVAEQDKAASQTVLDEFLAADIVVIGAPMYNFAIPSQLKAWVDRILIPGKTFRYSEAGVQGLAGDKRVIIAVSRGNFYGAETPFAAAEHAETYLRTAFGFIGVTQLEIIIVEGVQRGPEQRQTALDGALLAAATLRAA